MQQNFVIYRQSAYDFGMRAWCVETKTGETLVKTYHSSRTKAFNELVKRTRGATVFIVSAQTPEKGT